MTRSILVRSLAIVAITVASRVVGDHYEVHGPTATWLSMLTSALIITLWDVSRIMAMLDAQKTRKSNRNS